MGRPTEASTVPVPVGGRRSSSRPAQPAQLGGEHQPDRHRVAVPQPVALHPLDGVAERVPVVEDLAEAVSVRSFATTSALTRWRARPARAAGAGAAPRRVGLDQVEDRGSAMKPVLITSASPRRSRRAAASRACPGRRARRPAGGTRRPGSCRVGVDAGLAADGGVDHAEQRGRHQHHPDAAQPGRGDEPGQVGGRSPADADDGVGAGEAGRPSYVPEPPATSASWPPRRPAPRAALTTAGAQRRAAAGRRRRGPGGWTTATRRPSRPARGQLARRPSRSTTSYGADRRRRSSSRSSRRTRLRSRSPRPTRSAGRRGRRWTTVTWPPLVDRRSRSSSMVRSCRAGCRPAAAGPAGRSAGPRRPNRRRR